jgi:ADP-ribose pyrophosphatase YjhB (NUDIX family)
VVTGDLVERRQRVAAYGLIVAGGSILLARIAAGYPGAGNWTLPGGGLDWGEAPQDALHRELYEETGLRGDIRGLLGIDSLSFERTRDGKRIGFHGLRIIYEVAAEGEPRVTEVNGSVAEASWFLLGEIPQVATVDLVPTALRMLARAGR